MKYLYFLFLIAYRMEISRLATKRPVKNYNCQLSISAKCLMLPFPLSTLTAIPRFDRNHSICSFSVLTRLGRHLAMLQLLHHHPTFMWLLLSASLLPLLLLLASSSCSFAIVDCNARLSILPTVTTIRDPEQPHFPTKI